MEPVYYVIEYIEFVLENALDFRIGKKRFWTIALHVRGREHQHVREAAVLLF